MATHKSFCIKGKVSQDFNNGEDRLRQSRKRNIDGSHQAIANEVAMDEIAARLKTIIDTHGPDSVALYHATGRYSSALTHATTRSWIHSLGSHKIFSSFLTTVMR